MNMENRPSGMSEDPRLVEALEIVLKERQASTSLLQRRMRIGYTRATQLIYDLERRGLVSGAEIDAPYGSRLYGNRPRVLTLTDAQYRAMAEKLMESNPPI